MKKLILLLVTIFTIQVSGQTHLVGMKGGINSTNVTSTNFLSGNDSRRGVIAGLTYDFLFKKYFSIGADLLYNERGISNNVIFTDKYGNPTGEKNITKFYYDYLSVPLKAGVNIGTKFYGFANIGLVPSYLLESKTTVPNFDANSQVTGNVTFDLTDRVSKFDCAGFGEIGGGYKFKNRIWLFTSLAYQSSFTTITNSDYFAFSTIKHNGVSLMVGFKYSLSKNN